MLSELPVNDDDDSGGGGDGGGGGGGAFLPYFRTGVYPSAVLFVPS